MIKIIDRILKINAIDCGLNIHGNIFPSEVEKYRDCETEKNPILCSPLCDFTNCDYKCAYKVPKKELTFEELDTVTYNLYHFKSELQYLKKYIKFLFRISAAWTSKQISDMIIKKDYAEKNYLDVGGLSDKLKEIQRKIDYVDIKYIYLALDEIIKKKEIVTNKFKNRGNIVYKGKYYLFQPFGSNNNDNVQNRDVPKFQLRETSVNINNFLQKYYVLEDIKRKETKLNDVRKKIESLKNKDYEMVSKYIGNLPFDTQIQLLEGAIELNNEDQLSNKNQEYTQLVLRFFERYLIDDQKFQGKYNY